MTFKKGDKKPEGSGKQKGTQNHLTRSVKEAFHEAFNTMQDEPATSLVNWGKKNPTEFYKLASKLIPADINAKLTGNVKVNGNITFIKPKGD